MHLSWSASAIGSTDTRARHRDDLGDRVSVDSRTVPTATGNAAATPAPPPGDVRTASAP
jgi:hypothetical protein